MLRRRVGLPGCGSAPGSATLAAGDKLATAVDRRGKNEREKVAEKRLRVVSVNVGTTNKRYG